MRHVLSICGALLLAGGGCNIFDNNGSPGAGPMISAEVGRQVKAVASRADQLHQGQIALIRDASAGFTIDLSASPASVDPNVVDAHLLAIQQSINDYLADAHRLAVSADTTGQTSSPLKIPDGLGVKRQPIIGHLALAAGLAYFGYQLFSGMGEVLDTRAGPLRRRINEATPQELDIIGGVLQLPPGSDQQTVLDAFDALSPGERNAKRSQIEEQLGARQLEQGVNPLEASEVNQSIADAAVDAGEDAVNLTVGGLTTAAGGQLMSEAMQGVGLSAEVAAVADLGLTVTNNQPLDWVSRSVDISVSSQTKQAVTLPPPTDTLTVEQARAALSDGVVAAEDEDAVLTLVRDVASRDPGATTNNDGTITVQVPRRVHFSGQNTVIKNGELTIDIPEMGKADLVVAPQDKPVLVDVIDTQGGATVVYRDGDSLDTPDAGVDTPPGTFPRVYEGPATMTRTLHITWDGGSSIECDGSGVFAATLETAQTIRITGEIDRKPSFNSNGAYCMDAPESIWIGTGTVTGDGFSIDVHYESKTVQMVGTFNDDQLEGSYTVTWTGVLAGWGELTKSETLSIYLPRKQ